MKNAFLFWHTHFDELLNGGEDAKLIWGATLKNCRC